MINTLRKLKLDGEKIESEKLIGALNQCSIAHSACSTCKDVKTCERLYLYLVNKGLVIWSDKYATPETVNKISKKKMQREWYITRK